MTSKNETPNKKTPKTPKEKQDALEAEARNTLARMERESDMFGGRNTGFFLFRTREGVSKRMRLAIGIARVLVFGGALLYLISLLASGSGGAS